MMRHLAVVTVGRSDYSHYLPVLRRLRSEPSVRLSLIVAATHLVSEFGQTIGAIEADGFEVNERVEMTLASETPEAIATSIGLGVIGFAHAYERLRPDLFLLLGDRYEMLAAASAALPFTRPIAHIAGGELTEGAMDDAIRHALTKMSHLHFVSTERYRQRVIQMGEAPDRVFLSGAPSLDNLSTMTLSDSRSLEREFGISLSPAPLLVTFHPVTRDTEDSRTHVSELLSAINASALPAIFTFPSADTGWRHIVNEVKQFAAKGEKHRLLINLGTKAYFSLLRYAAAMVGNSSSGIIEAASFKLPVINVGDRQRGRLHDRNVVDVPCERSAILHAIRQVTSPGFRATLEDLRNPYGDGRAAEVIVSVLRNVALDRKLITKSFYDLSGVLGA